MKMEPIAVCIKCNTEAEVIETKLEDWQGTEEGVKRTVYYVEVTECCQSGFDIVDRPLDNEQIEDDHQDQLLLEAKEERVKSE